MRGRALLRALSFPSPPSLPGYRLWSPAPALSSVPVSSVLCLRRTPNPEHPQTAPHSPVSLLNAQTRASQPWSWMIPCCGGLASAPLASVLLMQWHPVPQTVSRQSPRPPGGAQIAPVQSHCPREPNLLDGTGVLSGAPPLILSHYFVTVSGQVPGEAAQ